jgi:hypothetical protein
MQTPLDRVAQQLRAAQDASDKLSAFLSARADAGHYIQGIARDLAESIALAETSLLAAHPHRWVASAPDTVPLADLALDGTTCVAWGERDGVLHILDVYETEASCDLPLNPSRTFRPMFLPQARSVSRWRGILLGAAVALCTSATAVFLLRAVIRTIWSNS